MTNFAELFGSVLRLSKNIGFYMSVTDSNGFGLEESTDRQIVESFLQFMVYVTCERLIEEHVKYIRTLLFGIDFGDDENLDRFKNAMLLLNELAAILSHWDFPHCVFQTKRALKDLRRVEKKFCEIADRKIERAQEENWAKNTQSMLMKGNQQFGNRFK